MLVPAEEEADRGAASAAADRGVAGAAGAAWPPCPALRSMLAMLGSSPTSLRKSVKRSSSRTSCPRSVSYFAANRSRASASGARSSTFCSVRLAPCWEMGLELMEERRSAAYVSGDSLTPRTSRHCATSGVMGSAIQAWCNNGSARNPDFARSGAE